MGSRVSTARGLRQGPRGHTSPGRAGERMARTRRLWLLPTHTQPRSAACFANCGISLTDAARDAGLGNSHRRMRLCSVPVTPDPGFPSQGQLLFSLPQGSKAVLLPPPRSLPCPLQRSRPEESTSGRAPGPRDPTTRRSRPLLPNSPGA